MTRLENLAKGGYFPFPTSILPEVARMFKQPQVKGGKMLDNTAGEASAIQYLSKAWGLEPYAVELSTERAALAVQKLGARNAMCDDAFKADISTNAFSIVWSNPPFAHDKHSERGERREYEFVRNNWKYAYQRGGYHIIVCYTHHINDKMASSLATHSTEIDVWRVPGFDLGEYMMVVIVAKLAQGGVATDTAYQTVMNLQKAAMRNYALNQFSKERELTAEEEAELFPSIFTAGNDIYQIAEPQTVKKMMFKRSVRNLETVIAAWDILGPHKGDKFAELVKPMPPVTDIRPLIMPKKGQLPGLIAGGLFNGLYLEYVNELDKEGKIFCNEKGKAIIRSIISQKEVEVDKEEEEDAKNTVVTTVRVVPTPTIVLLYENGEIQNISGDDALSGFVRANLTPLLDYVQKNFDPRYKFDLGTPALAEFIHSIRLRKNGESHPMFSTQKHYAAAAITTMWQDFSFTASATPGFGKTLHGAVVMEAFRHRLPEDKHYEIFKSIPRRKRMRPDQFNIVVCPAHLVKKWVNEIKAVNSQAYVGSIYSGESLNPLEETMNFIRGIDKQAPDTLKVLVISKELFKVADAAIKGVSPWTPAVNYRRERNAAGEIVRIPIDPVTGLDAIQKITRGGDVTHFTDKKLGQVRSFNGFWWNRSKRTAWRNEINHNATEGSLKKRVLMDAGFARWGGDELDETLLERSTQEGRLNIAIKQAMDKNRRQRIKAEQNPENAPYMPLFNEQRTTSSADRLHKTVSDDGTVTFISRAELLAQKMGTTKTSKVVPLPDLVAKHLNESDYTAPKNPRGPLAGIADVIAKHYGDRLYMFIPDEWHEYKDPDSAQGMACGRLANACTRFMPMTGTLYGGPASSVRYMTFLADSNGIRQRYPWGSPGKAQFVADMGVLEYTLTSTDEVTSSGRGTSRVTRRSDIREVPGASPALLKELIGSVGFVDLRDLGRWLPDFNEEGFPIELGQLAPAYARADNALTSYLNACLTQNDSSFLSAYFHALLSYPNYPYFDMEVWHRKTMELPDGTEELFERLVYTIPGIGEHAPMTPKEEWLIQQINNELAEGRGVGVYVSQTGKDKVLQTRLKKLIEEHCALARPVILTRHVPTGKREEWLEKQKDKNVLICNANLVKTGLDLIQFPTLIFFELFYSLYTMEQAKGRAWRAIQKKDCKVLYPFYVSEIGRAETPVEIITDQAIAENTVSDDEIAVDENLDVWEDALDEISDDEVIEDRVDTHEKRGLAEGEYRLDTMEARGVELVSRKREAAAFLYGSGGGSLSSMTGGAGGSLIKELREAMENSNVGEIVDSTSLFKKALIEDEESDWHSEEDSQDNETVIAEIRETALVEAVEEEAVVEFEDAAPVEPDNIGRQIFTINRLEYRGDFIWTTGVKPDGARDYTTVYLNETHMNMLEFVGIEPQIRAMKFDDINIIIRMDDKNKVFVLDGVWSGEHGMFIDEETFNTLSTKDIEETADVIEVIAEVEGVELVSDEPVFVEEYTPIDIIHDEEIVLTESEEFEFSEDAPSIRIITAEEMMGSRQLWDVAYSVLQRGTSKNIDVVTNEGWAIGKISHEELERFIVIHREWKEVNQPVAQHNEQVIEEPVNPVSKKPVFKLSSGVSALFGRK